MTTTPELASLLESLRPPRIDLDGNREIQDSSLEAWKSQIHGPLSQLRDFDLNTLPLETQADIVTAVAPLTIPEHTYNSETVSLASEILSRMLPVSGPSRDLLHHLLAEKIKPIFRANPHPSLNTSTGRKLPRPAGGPMASQDLFEGQVWKEQPECIGLVLWCLRHIKTEDYERLWYLIIPPVMTLIDDYEVRYKTWGVRLVAIVIENAPNGFLKRTGVDGLFRTSLKNCLGHLQVPESAQLLKITISATIALVNVSAKTPSESFEMLCELLGDGIIGTVWVYSMENLPVVLASVEVLPLLFKALGVGSSRFLKALIPQLVYPLIPREQQTPSRELQISSLKALEALIEACPPRIQFWKGTILSAVAKCWFTIHEDPGQEDLKGLLRDLCGQLSRTCPSIEDEYKQLLEADEDTFRPLLRLDDGQQ